MAESETSAPTNGHGLTDVAGKIGSIAGQAQSTASLLTAQVGDKVHDGTQQGVSWFQQTLQENPLAVGAAALAVGAALGFLLPETAAENRLMGRAHDRFATKAQEAAQDLAHKAGAVAHEAFGTAVEAAKEEAKEQGLTS